MTRIELMFPATIILVTAALLAAGVFVLEYSWVVVAFPLGTGALLCLLCAAEIARWLGRWRSGQLEDSKPHAMGAQARSLVWFFLLAPLLYGLGFVIGSAVFLFAYIRAHGHSWRLAAAISATSAIIVWGLFIRLLEIPLPASPLWMP